MSNFKKKKVFRLKYLKVLPHRYPLFVDKVEIKNLGNNLIAQKNVTINEPCFQGHFPNQPVLPGVLTIEMMAQAGSFLILSQVDNPLTKNMFFSSVENAKFKKPVIPGDILKIHITLIKKRLGLCKFRGECFVESDLVACSNFC